MRERRGPGETYSCPTKILEGRQNCLRHNQEGCGVFGQELDQGWRAIMVEHVEGRRGRG